MVQQHPNFQGESLLASSTSHGLAHGLQISLTQVWKVQIAQIHCRDQKLLLTYFVQARGLGAVAQMRLET